MRPTLIVVSGPPASGKTTLAHALAQAIHCPAICRDAIKEGLVSGTESETFVPERGDAANLAATAAFFDVVQLMVRRGVTVVAEAAFQHHRWAPWITRFREVADIRIVNCEADVAVAHERRVRRWRDEPWRRRFHADPDLQQLARTDRSLSDPSYQPIHLEWPTLVVDTSDGYRPAFDEIVAFVQG
ncbi:MAG: AAA family ATPase [Chloroflexota bacterium]|nr:AAA family ATPase [Chloroflexota bacterium]